MALLIDSTVIISVERTAQAPVTLLERLQGNRGALSTITASELLHGVHRAEGLARRARRQHFVETVLRLLPVLPVTLDVARFMPVSGPDFNREAR